MHEASMHPDLRLVPLVPMACQLDFIRVPYLEPPAFGFGGFELCASATGRKWPSDLDNTLTVIHSIPSPCALATLAPLQ